MKKSIDLTKGVIWKQLMLFCIPIMLGTLFQQLYNTVDVIVVGQFVGADAIASVGGSSGMIINLVVGLFVGLSAGVTVVISKFYGSKDNEKIVKGIDTTIVFASIGSIFFTIFGIMLVPNMLKILNTPQSIMKYSSQYLTIYFSGIIFVFLYNTGSAVLRAVGDSQSPLYYLIVCCFVNVVLDVILVVFVKLGVAGVAIATVSAQAVSAVLTIQKLQKLKNKLHLQERKLHFDKNVLCEILWIGFPAAFQSLMNSISGMVMTFAVNGLGTIAMAGNTSYAKLDQIFWMISTTFSVTTATFVGQNMGAGNKERVKNGVKVCLGLDLLLSGMLTVFFLSCGKNLFYLFTNEISVIDSGMEVLKAIAPYYVLVAFYEITGSALRGIGNVILPMIFNIIGLCGIRIFWICVILSIFPQWNHLYGIILSCPISWLFTAIVTCIYYIIVTKNRKFTFKG